MKTLEQVQEFIKSSQQVCAKRANLEKVYTNIEGYESWMTAVCELEKILDFINSETGYDGSLIGFPPQLKSGDSNENN